MANYLGTVMTGLTVATGFIVALKKGAFEGELLFVLCVVGTLGFCLVAGSSLAQTSAGQTTIRGYGIALLVATTSTLIFYGFLL